MLRLALPLRSRFLSLLGVAHGKTVSTITVFAISTEVELASSTMVLEIVSLFLFNPGPFLEFIMLSAPAVIKTEFLHCQL